MTEAIGGPLAAPEAAEGPVGGPTGASLPDRRPAVSPVGYDPSRLHPKPQAAPTSTSSSAGSASLTFSDVPGDLSQLRPRFDDIYTSAQDLTTSTPNTSLTTQSLASDPATPSTTATSTRSTPSTQCTSQSSTPASIQPRRPSPGLAARLKALGFGKKSSQDLSQNSTYTTYEHIGRLPEEQLRQLDKKHQAGSVASIVRRRGRPWKGASAPAVAASKDADDNVRLASPTAAAAASPVNGPVDAAAPNNHECGSESATPIPQADPSGVFLPQIAMSEPLDMDTQKYRLPDHTNGNGTKTVPETRQEHVERNVRPPSLSDDDIDDPSPPPPLPKDTPPTQHAAEFVPNLDSYFSSNHQRAGSIYTLSRASFANQLAQLTSLQLPDAESLSSKVSAIPTAHAASTALINAAEQIRSWISKASEVIAGLNSEDDVEWAAAGGREGMVEVENATSKFEELINVYVSAIEELQSRKDIANVPPEVLKHAVNQMESIINEWANIRTTLGSVKEQVEIAMEWEELWNVVLGDINGEVDELCRLVFEMEERRHKSIMAAANGDSVDIGDLETIVEETPAPLPKVPAQPRFSLPAFPMSPSSPSTPTLSHDDSSLLALFARMQPLRASLDFLPMRLSVFETRAQVSFPTACEELEMRREGLDATYKKLEKDAESLRKELGEDRWVLVFRGAGRQAQKMVESVERSFLKLKESVDAGHHLTNNAVVPKKIENYDAKKTHYGPAIERVLGIIDKGVKERLTVNGEILRLHSDMQSKWDSIKAQMVEMDAVLDETQCHYKGQQLRDSVSSMLSNDRSTIGSGQETPGSSPPSSVIMSSLGLEPITPTPKTTKSRGPNTPGSQPPSNRRHSSLPAPASQMTRKPLTSRASTTVTSGLPTPSGGKIPRPGSTTTVPNRPKWNTSTNTKDAGIGHNFKPLSLTTPSPYRKSPGTARSISSLTPGSGSKLQPARSPLNRSSSASPMPDDTPTRSTSSRLSFRERIGSPPSAAKPRLAPSNVTSSLGSRRASMQPPKSRNGAESEQPTRPASSLASGRRSSLLPRPASRTSGRDSPATLGTARNTSNTGPPNRPKWRP